MIPNTSQQLSRIERRLADNDAQQARLRARARALRVTRRLQADPTYRRRQAADKKLRATLHHLRICRARKRISLQVTREKLITTQAALDALAAQEQQALVKQQALHAKLAQSERTAQEAEDHDDSPLSASPDAPSPDAPPAQQPTGGPSLHP
jgi:hypothetical protein